jgi:hypothetical protein
MKRAWIALFVSTLSAQTTVYLRDHGKGFFVTGASNATPMTIQTGDAHGLAAGDRVNIWNVVFNSGPGCGSSTLDGHFKVKAVADATHFTITDPNGVDVPAHGVWCAGDLAGTPAGLQFGGKVAPYSLNPGAKGWFDGDNGAFTRSLSLGTNNGLVSLVVSGTTATVTTRFDNYASGGDQLAVWNSGSAALDNDHRAYTATVDNPRTFHFTVSGAIAKNYANGNNTCGPSGTSDCLRISLRAIAGNPWWDKVKSQSDASADPMGTRCNLDGGLTQSCLAIPNGGNNLPAYTHSIALRLFVDQANTTMKDALVYWLTHVERTNGVNWGVPENRANINDIDFMSLVFRDVSPLYVAAKAYLTAEQRQTFLDKILNDIRYQASPCNKVEPFTSATRTATYVGGLLTGSGTHWLTDSDPTQRVAPGDALYTSWGGFQLYVTAVTSDTSATVLLQGGAPAVVSTPFQYYLVHQWKAGDCGCLWMHSHWIGGLSQPVLYPPVGGSSTFGPYLLAHRPTPMSNNGFTLAAGYLAFAAVAADDDPRAATLFERTQNLYWDAALPAQWGYMTGMERAGSFYSFGRQFVHGPEAAMAIQNSVSGFPDLDLGGTWISRQTLAKIYGLAPYPYNAAWWPLRYGAETGQNQIDPGNYPGNSNSWMTNFILRFAPTSKEARYWRAFLTDKGLWSASAVNGNTAAEMFHANGDPKVGTLDYTTLPTQILLQATSQTNNVRNETGWDGRLRGDTVYSRTGWRSQSDTLVMFQARTYLNDHDLPQAGSLRVYKTGPLLNNAWQPAGQSMASDGTAVGSRDSILQFGESNGNINDGTDANFGTPAVAFIDRWAGDDAVYGDAQSRYVYARADVAGVYRVPIDRAKVHLAHFKKPGTEELILKYTDVDVSSHPIAVRAQIHYPQNGEPATQTSEPEGDTSCPGGCAALGTNRTILSQESGNGVYTNGVITKILTPGTAAVTWDGDSYPGSTSPNDGGHHDYRVSICGGSACGTAAGRLEVLEAHKISSSIADKTLTATALNPDANWTGVQTLDKVAMFSRQGIDRLVLKFQTTHAGTAQYLVAGLEAGHTYSVHRRDTGVDLTTQMVTSGANALYFEGGAGTYWIFPAQLAGLMLTSPPPLRKGKASVYDFKTAGAPAAFAWSVSVGRLPAGLQLSADGILSGTPAEAGDFALTIRASEPDAPEVFAEADMTLTVALPPVSLSVTAMGRGKAILWYGVAGLAGSANCAITVREQTDSAGVTTTDGGGAQRRVIVLGASAALRAGATYSATANCGALAGSATFTMPEPEEAASTSVDVLSAPPTALHAATVEAQYGPSVSLGNSVTGMCAATCRVAIPAQTGDVVYVKRVYRDAAGRVVAQSGVAPTVARRLPAD